MTSTETDLHVPDEAVDELLAHRDDWGREARDERAADVRKIASPVVAAELRRLADHYESAGANLVETDVPAFTVIVASLRARADALHPEEKR